MTDVLGHGEVVGEKQRPMCALAPGRVICPSINSYCCTFVRCILFIEIGGEIGLTRLIVKGADDKLELFYLSLDR